MLTTSQVMVSASRQEMVGHLLKDIVESSEKPSLSSQDPAYDQFGFRQEDLNGQETLEEKAEKLRRITQVVVVLRSKDLVNSVLMFPGELGGDSEPVDGEGGGGKVGRGGE